MIRYIRILLIILIIIMAAVVLFEITRPYRPENPVDNYVDNLVGGRELEPDDEEYQAFEAPVYIELPADAELEGLIVVTKERKDYVSGDMRLIIPSLELDQQVQNGVTQADLRAGPGLFDCSGMPGEDGANISIAGHRSRGSFYFLDKLGEGDFIYLVYDSYTYKYRYHDTVVVQPSDWSIVLAQDFDCCTLITCTPIDRADKRMAVRFILEEVSQ